MRILALIVGLCIAAPCDAGGLFRRRSYNYCQPHYTSYSGYTRTYSNYSKPTQSRLDWVKAEVLRGAAVNKEIRELASTFGLDYSAVAQAAGYPVYPQGYGGMQQFYANTQAGLYSSGLNPLTYAPQGDPNQQTVYYRSLGIKVNSPDVMAMAKMSSDFARLAQAGVNDAQAGFNQSLLAAINGNAQQGILAQLTQLQSVKSQGDAQTLATAAQAAAQASPKIEISQSAPVALESGKVSAEPSQYAEILSQTSMIQSHPGSALARQYCDRCHSGEEAKGGFSFDLPGPGQFAKAAEMIADGTMPKEGSPEAEAMTPIQRANTASWFDMLNTLGN